MELAAGTDSALLLPSRFMDIDCPVFIQNLASQDSMFAEAALAATLALTAARLPSTTMATLELITRHLCRVLSQLRMRLSTGGRRLATLATVQMLFVCAVSRQQSRVCGG
jgi:hypothetical protein